MSAAPDDPLTRPLPEGLLDTLIAFRRDLHRHPELSFEEHRTAGKVADALRELNLEPTTGVAKTGVLAEVGDPASGPTVVLRADLDALPIEEETGLPFASERPGVMHACAHDGHTAVLLGAAHLLVADPPTNGSVKLLFQPAEERGNGGELVSKEGHVTGASAVFGLHMDPRWPTGTLVVSEGPVNASSRSFVIEVIGKEAHAARPHLGVDAILTGAAIVQELQALVAREIEPGVPAVVTVGRFHAGTSHNILAGNALLSGTIRCFDNDLASRLRTGMERVAEGVARAHGAQALVRFGEGCPVVLNDPKITAIAREAAAEVVTSAGVHQLEAPNMGAEDFAFYLDHAPGCYVRLGGGIEGQEPISAHNSRFDWDERALAVGARYFETVARRAISALS